MDIHNTSKITWGDTPTAVRAEIEHLVKLGAQLQFLNSFCVWVDANENLNRDWYRLYRIKPETETKTQLQRPLDEMDIHNLTRICGEWHPETRSEMLAWKHGWEFAAAAGWRSTEHKTPSWSFGTCYRAKRAQLNLIERTASRDNAEIATLHEALVQADKIIKSLGSIVNTDAYKNAIK